MDHYATLGISRGANKDEIKKAFHKLAHIHHPDKGGDAEMFKKINNAYQSLMKGNDYGSFTVDNDFDFS